MNCLYRACMRVINRDNTYNLYIIFFQLHFNRARATLLQNIKICHFIVLDEKDIISTNEIEMTYSSMTIFFMTYTMVARCDYSCRWIGDERIGTNRKIVACKKGKTSANSNESWHRSIFYNEMEIEANIAIEEQEGTRNANISEQIFTAWFLRSCYEPHYTGIGAIL